MSTFAGKFLAGDVKGDHSALLKSMATCAETRDTRDVTAWLSDALEVPVTVELHSSGGLEIAAQDSELAPNLAKYFTKVVALATVLNSGESSDVRSASTASGVNPVVVRLAIFDVRLGPTVSPKTTDTAAKDWLLNVVDEVNGRYIKKVKSQNGGRVVVVHVKDIPEDIFESVFMRTLAGKGHVTRWTGPQVAVQVDRDDGFKMEMQEKAAAVGNMKETGSLISRLADLRGEGGNGAKRRRFADQAMGAFSLSQKVCASKLKEAKDAPDDDDA